MKPWRAAWAGRGRVISMFPAAVEKLSEHGGKTWAGRTPAENVFSACGTAQHSGPLHLYKLVLNIVRVNGGIIVLLAYFAGHVPVCIVGNMVHPKTIHFRAFSYDLG
jgi:hypothetical protein